MPKLVDGKNPEFVTTKDLMEHYAAVRKRLWNRQKTVNKLKPSVNTVAAYFVQPMRFAFTNGIEVDPDLRPPMSVLQIIKVACKYYGISYTEMLSVRREKKLCTARHVAMYLCHKLTSNSYPQIGSKFGGRDHTTVLHGVRKVGELVAKDAPIKRDIEALRAALGE